MEAKMGNCLKSQPKVLLNSLKGLSECALWWSHEAPRRTCPSTTLVSNLIHVACPWGSLVFQHVRQFYTTALNCVTSQILLWIINKCGIYLLVTRKSYLIGLRTVFGQIFGEFFHTKWKKYDLIWCCFTQREIESTRSQIQLNIDKRGQTHVSCSADGLLWHSDLGVLGVTKVKLLIPSYSNHITVRFWNYSAWKSQG